MMPTVSCLDMVLNPHPKEPEELGRVLDGEWNYSFLLSQFLGARIGWRRGRSCEPGGLKHKGSWEIHTEKTEKNTAAVSACGSGPSHLAFQGLSFPSCDLGLLVLALTFGSRDSEE